MASAVLMRDDLGSPPPSSSLAQPFPNFPMHSKPPRTSKGLLYLPGLRIVIYVLAGFLLAATIGAAVLHLNLVLPETAADNGADLEAPLLGVLAIMVPVEWVAFFAVRKGLRKQLEESLVESTPQPGGNLPLPFVTITLIGALMTSGIGFFGATIHVITGSWAALSIAGAASLFILYQVPSDDSPRGI